MKNLSEVKVVSFGIVIMLVAAILFAGIFAGTVLWGWIPENSLRLMGGVVTFLAAVIGGGVVGKSATGGALPKALVAALGYLLLVFILRGILFRSVGEGVWVPVLAAVLGATVGAFLTAGKGKKRRRR